MSLYHVPPPCSSSAAFKEHVKTGFHPTAVVFVHEPAVKSTLEFLSLMMKRLCVLSVIGEPGHIKRPLKHQNVS